MPREFMTGELFGAPLTVCIIAGIIWALVCLATIGNHPISAFLALFLGWITGRVFAFASETHFAPVLKGIGLVILAGILLAGLIFAAVHMGDHRRFVGTGGGGKTGTGPLPPPPPPVPPVSVLPLILWHGCKSLQIAKDILFNDRWLVGNAKPPSVWLTDNYYYAWNHAGVNGYVLKVSVSPDVQLTNEGNGIWRASIPNAEKFSQYYRIPGVRATEIYDHFKNKVI